jgi:hypothetical protein
MGRRSRAPLSSEVLRALRISVQSETVSGVDEKLLMTNRSGRGRQFSAPAAILALLGCIPVAKAGSPAHQRNRLD